jgi:hypothetical protein
MAAIARPGVAVNASLAFRAKRAEKADKRADNPLKALWFLRLNEINP